MRCPLGRYVAVLLAVLFSLGTGVPASTPTRAEAAPPRKPTTFSATLPVTTALPIVLATLSNGLVISGDCLITLPPIGFPIFKISLIITPGTGADGIVVQGFSYAHTLVSNEIGFKGQVAPTSNLGSVGVALIAVPVDADGVPLGDALRIEIQGGHTATVTGGCSFTGLVF